MQSLSIINLWRREFSGYDLDKFRQDLLAGLTVGAGTLPFALVLGVASGSTAMAGLVTAIIAGLIIGALSGAHYQISGPTAAVSALLIVVSQKYGIEGVWVASFISGVILLLLGIFRLGRFIAFIPAPVISGFTSGIALIILTGQINNLFGINTPDITWGWLRSLGALFGNDSTLIKLLSYVQLNYSANWNSIFVGTMTMLTMIAWPAKWSKYMPGALVGIIAATLLTWLAGFNNTLIGEIPSILFLENRLHFEFIPWANSGTLILPILSIATLIAVESLLCGSVGSTMTGTSLNTNTELIAQGIGNIILPFFGGLPAAAAIDRTSAGIRSGGVTRLVSIIHSVVLLLAALILLPILGLIPLTALAGVLMVTAYRMNALQTINFMIGHRYLLDSAIFIGIIIVILLLGLPWAIALTAIGVTVFMLRGRMFQLAAKKAASNSKRKIGSRQKNADKSSKVIHLQNTLFVATLDQLNHETAQIESGIRTVILSLQNVSMIDVAGVQAIAILGDRLKNKGQQLLIAGAHSSVQQMLNQGGLEKILGANNFFTNSGQALTEAERRNARLSGTFEASEPVWNGSTALALYRPSHPELAKGRKKRV